VRSSQSHNREKEASTEAVLQSIMAEAEADVASQARTEAELRRMLAETTDRCSRLQFQSEMADKRLDLIRHNSTDAPAGSHSRPLSAKATSPKVCNTGPTRLVWSRPITQFGLQALEPARWCLGGC